MKYFPSRPVLLQLITACATLMLATACPSTTGDNDAGTPDSGSDDGVTDLIDPDDPDDPDDDPEDDGGVGDDDGGVDDDSDMDVDMDDVDPDCDQYITLDDCEAAAGCDPITATPFVAVSGGYCLAEEESETIMLDCVDDRCSIEGNWCDTDDGGKPYHVVGCPETGTLGCTVPAPSSGCDFDGGLPMVDGGPGADDGGPGVDDGGPGAGDAGTDGGMPLPETVYDLKQGNIPVAEPIDLADMVVTAVHPTGFFAQLQASAPDYAGEEFSCSWVATGNAPTVSRGQVISFSAVTAETGGQLHLTSPTAISVDGAASPFPKLMVPSVYAPEVVLGASSGFEGCLVKVQNVLVTDADVDPGPGYSGSIEFEIEMGLHLSDFFTTVSPVPQDGDELLFATGPLMFRNTHLKLMWREQADILIMP